jgi:phosphatidate cytidylyltransferase
MRSDVAIDDSAASAAEGQKRGGGRREIVLRVISALILAPLGLAACWYGGPTLWIATGLCGVVAAIEWTRMAAQTEATWARWALYLVMAAGAAGAVWFGSQRLELVALISLATSAAAGLLSWAGKGSVSSMAFGAIYTSLPFGAFVWIRESQTSGQYYLIALLAIVWATDIAAYFAGRGFGGPLLSPKDSPNKTWTGAIGALVCAGLAGAAFARAVGGDFMHWLLASLIISVVAQAGDLLESRFKRLYGVKDTSGVVPGHGGVLDRLDALMAAAVLGALVLRFLPDLAPGFVGQAGAG